MWGWLLRREGANQQSLRSVCRYLEEELVLSDPLHRLDKVGGDGVGQSVPLLDLLLETASSEHSEV